ncbi:MAG TPA: L-serine ammonia-lyase, iron-sulfur-dependent subunit beta [Thermotogota bacterium]|nr:L-serine ammonia-lyase, iron-sulfur-dependent subunit beta [Thermotogota bacterium]HPR97643.1 L-serine ammonia-lyase, iron-sulfur-dependent subunit beta [Thermotogota bacterium]
MKNYSVFDILGPVMIGPSSSHTAGAARIGKMARNIAGPDFDKVEFHLHGSFAKTYKGHGTDRALVAGVMGMEPHDLRLSRSLEIAEENGITIEFYEIDLGAVHPNTVKVIVFGRKGDQTEIIASSVGGGNIVVSSINGYSIKVRGEYPAIVIMHQDKPGVISEVSSLLSRNGINVAKMRVSRKEKGHSASMVIETDEVISDSLRRRLLKIDNINTVRVINPSREEF